MAPTGSSTLISSKKSTENTTRMPARAPMTTALKGVTLLQGAVMATSPARAPLRLMEMSGLPNLSQEVIMARTHPAAAARLVFTKIQEMSLMAAVVDPGVEPEPAQPEDEHAQGGQGHVVAQDGLWFSPHVFTQPRPQNNGSGQPDPGPHGVDHGGAGEIDEAQVFQPALTLVQATPGPGTEDGINQGADHEGVDQIGNELGPLGHGPGNNGRGCGAEDHLEHPEGQDPGIGPAAGNPVRKEKNRRSRTSRWR